MSAWDEAAICEWLNRKYVQRADARQKAMGLQYMTAETHDLAKEVARMLAARDAETWAQACKAMREATEAALAQLHFRSARDTCIAHIRALAPPQKGPPA